MPPRSGTSLLFFFLAQMASQGVSGVTCPSQPINYEKELKKCLFANYDKSVRPAADGDTIQTVIHMGIRYIDLEEHVNNLRIHAWISWEWTDENLKWNPADFGNKRTIKVFSDDIWQPDVSLMTTDDASMHFGMPSTHCQVTNTGKVFCAPPTTLVAHCAPDLSRWPFDVQTCTAVLGSWTMLANKLNLTLQGPGVSAEMMLASRLWELQKSRAQVVQISQGSSKVDTYPTVEFTFTLRRHGAGDAATAVAPALVLATATLLTLVLEPDCGERLALGGVNVLAHVLYLQYTSWRLPPNGDSVPAIVIFFRDSLLLLGGALVLSVATRLLVRARAAPPSWLRSAAASLLACAPGQLLLLGHLSPRGAAATAATAGEDGTTLVGAGGGGGGGGNASAGDGEGGVDGDDTWRLAAVFLDRVALAVFSLALLGLLVRYVA